MNRNIKVLLENGFFMFVAGAVLALLSIIWLGVHITLLLASIMLAIGLVVFIVATIRAMWKG